MQDYNQKKHLTDFFFLKFVIFVLNNVLLQPNNLLK